MSRQEFYTFFLLHRPIYRVANERNYWLIEMSLSETLKESAFSFIALSSVDKAIFQFLLIILDCVKGTLPSKQQKTSNATQLKALGGNTRNFSFLCCWWNVHQNVLIPWNLSSLDKFLVTRLYYNGWSTDSYAKDSIHRSIGRAL